MLPHHRPQAGDEAAVAEARHALRTPSAAPDARVLGAVHHGLLAVDAGDTPAEVTVEDPYPQMAIRRRDGL